MPEKTTVRAIRFPIALYKDLKGEAKQQGRSITNYIIYLLERRQK
jgi:hypothetical protein